MFSLQKSSGLSSDNGVTLVLSSGQLPSALTLCQYSEAPFQKSCDYATGIIFIFPLSLSPLLLADNYRRVSMLIFKDRLKKGKLENTRNYSGLD